jgi:hypothetical protein
MGTVVSVEQERIDVIYPEMRDEIIDAVRTLSDPEYQFRTWVLREVPPDRIEDFDINIHILYDDTGVLENPHAAIGDVLETAAEADALTKLAHAIDSMFERVGTDLTDEQYLALPDWKSVVDAARNALSVLTGNA